ncbi:hypothetical protein Tco_1405948 [Tanacetum coccineum]
MKMCKFFIPLLTEAISPANNASQYMAWSDALNFKLMAYECIFSTRLTRIILTPEPSLIASLPRLFSGILLCELMLAPFFLLGCSIFPFLVVGDSHRRQVLGPLPSLPSERSLSSHSFIAAIASAPLIPSE